MRAAEWGGGRVPVEDPSDVRTKLADFFNSLSNSGDGILLPVPTKFVELRKRRHIGHTIQKQFANQVIHLVLDTGRIETGRFEIHRFAITIQRLNPHE